MYRFSIAVLVIAVVIVSILAVSFTAQPARGQAIGTITVTIRCGSPTGCGSVAYGQPIDVAGSVRAHRTDTPAQDVNASFTVADRGSFKLELPVGTYDLYAAAFGYQTALLGHVSVIAVGESSWVFNLEPCPSTGCVPIPEFGSQSTSALATVLALTAVLVTTRRKHRRRNMVYDIF